MGAIAGPCNGHLSLSQVAFVEGSVVGQVNSSPRTMQTCAVCPGQNACIDYRPRLLGWPKITEGYKKIRKNRTKCRVFKMGPSV